MPPPLLVCADIEVERMRAAATPGSSDGSLQLHLPGGSGTLATGAGRGRQSDVMTDTTSAGGSSMLAAGGR